MIKDASGPSSHGPLQVEQQFFSRSLPCPVETLGSNAPFGDPVIQRVEFEMKMLPPPQDDQSDENCHIYTTIQSETAAHPRLLEDIPKWRDTWPRLTKLLHQGELNTQMVLLETNFHLMTNHPPAGSRLAIPLVADFDCDTKHSEWRSVTYFYEHGHQRQEITGFPNTVPVENTCKMRVGIPLASEWWATLFHRITSRRLRVSADGTPAMVEQEARNAVRYIQGMNILQELFTVPSNRDAEPKRVAILLWKFRQTSPGEVATTTWRKINPPPSRIAVNSPAPPMLQPPIRLDSTILDPVHPSQMQSARSDFMPLYENGSFLSQAAENLMAEHCSDNGLGSPLVVQSCPSFTSSTAASTLISNGRHDSGYGSSISQFSTQSHLSDHGGGHDFSGGHIHLAYTEAGPQASSYDASLVAPIPEMYMQQPNHPQTHYAQPNYTYQNYPSAPTQLQNHAHQMTQPSEHQARMQQYPHATQQYQQHIQQRIPSTQWYPALRPPLFSDLEPHHLQFGEMRSLAPASAHVQPPLQHGQILGEVGDVVDQERKFYH